MCSGAEISGEGKEMTDAKKTELVIIIDKSGSMHGLEEDTIGGVNAMLEGQKKLKGSACKVTTVLFDSHMKVLHDRLDIEEIEALNGADYKAGGTTALIDALGETITHISDIHKYARKEDVPEKTIFFVTTDGMENASHKFTSAEVKKLIEKKQEENGWEFIFAAANIDAVETGARYGFKEGMSFNYVHDSVGTQTMYECASEYIECARSGRAAAGWKKKAEADFKKRG